ncbi:hypothetical protein ACEE90_01305 [Corynebacterium phoceense]
MKLMPSLIASILLIASLAGCSTAKEADPEMTAKIDDLQKQVDDLKLMEAGKLACFDAIDDAVADSDNMPIPAHNPHAEFILQDATESAHLGMMNWDVTIYTKGGIPWEHRANCTVDVSKDPVKVLTASVKRTDEL